MTIDLSRLPVPAVVEPLDFETIVATLKADVMALDPSLAEMLALESEPIVKLVEAFGYRELLLRARINHAAKATMLAHAETSDLDNLVALLGVQRLDDELDDRLRRRAQLALESYSTAGPAQSYIFHALSASQEVHDVTVSSPKPGAVRLVVLAVPSDDNPGGVPGQTLLDAVQAACSAEDVRPLTDTVLTAPAEVIPYAVQAALTCLPGVSAAIVVEVAQAATEAYVAEQFVLGCDITVSGLYQALRQPGVARVTLISPPLPVSDDPEEQDVVIAVANNQAARCTSVTVMLGGVGA